MAGGGDGEFGFAGAAQEVVEEVGDEEEGVGGVEDFAVLLAHGEELEEGVDLHELNAGGVEDFFAGDFGKGAFHRAACAGVAVHGGVGEDFAAGGEESEIDAPGIDTDAGEGAAEVGAGVGKAGFEFLPLGEEVPLEAAEHFAARVGESVGFGEGEFSGIEGGEDGAAAFGSEIKGEEMGWHNWWSLGGRLISYRGAHASENLRGLPGGGRRGGGARGGGCDWDKF